jgi:hypothetical protein
LQGKQGEFINAKLHGDAYTQNYRGSVYVAAVAATGIVTTIFSNTTYVGPLLWNPQGSGHNIVPIRAMKSRILAATTVCGWGHAFLANSGAGLGTAVSAFTTGTLRGAANNPGVIGQGSSIALWGVGATLGTAFTWGRSNGMAAGTETTAIVEQVFVEEFKGELIIPPGTLWAPWAATAAQGGTWADAVVWEETPL